MRDMFRIKRNIFLLNTGIKIIKVMGTKTLTHFKLYKGPKKYLTLIDSGVGLNRSYKTDLFVR